MRIQARRAGASVLAIVFSSVVVDAQTGSPIVEGIRPSWLSLTGAAGLAAIGGGYDGPGTVDDA